MPSRGRGQECCVLDQGRRRELVRRFKEGDGEAFRSLFEDHARVLRTRAARRLPGHLSKRVSIADIVQDACLEAFRLRDRFEDRGHDAFRNWMFGIVDNKVRETVRHHGRTRKRATDREISRSRRRDTNALLGDGRSPSAAAISGERVARIRRAMASLPDAYREVLHLTLEEGLVLREVAERIGKSREATKKLYGRALCRLREACQDEETDRG